MGIQAESAKYEKVVDELQELEQTLRKQAARKTQEKEKKPKLDIKKKVEAKTIKKASNAGKLNVKLPKMVITKFHGTQLDWQRFWGQFEATIDKSDTGQVAKVSYLKELLLPRVRAVIDGLPFNSEGYTRAKNIIITKYSKPRKVAHAHIQCIIRLTVITGTNPTGINEFYKKLVTSIQTLESMGKDKDIRGYVRLTLDTLPGIRSDLVRMNNNWKKWRFPQLVEALRKWL